MSIQKLTYKGQDFNIGDRFKDAKRGPDNTRLMEIVTLSEPVEGSYRKSHGRASLQVIEGTARQKAKLLQMDIDWLAGSNFTRVVDTAATTQ